MKGYLKDGKDLPPCGTCKHKGRMTVEAPCYGCIDTVDLALHKPNYETEFSNYEPLEGLIE